ncbi:MAG: dihydropyrimidinase [Acidimicrobiaceae bacterium]
MAHDLVLRNGVVVTPTGPINGGVAVDHGRIVQVGDSSTLGDAHRDIDLDGRTVLPGLMDPHVHFGFGDDIGDDTMAEDFRHNSKDCLIGGVTTIATTTMTGRDSLTSLFDRAVAAADGKSSCDYKFTTVVGGRHQIEEIPQVVARGGVSFKFFTGYIGAQAEGFGIDPSGITPDMFFEAGEALAKAGSPVFAAIHAEDPYVRGILVDRLRAETGAQDHQLVAWGESSPDFAESLQIYTFGLVAQRAGVPLYPVHVSAAKTVDTIQRMRADGVNLVGETLALFLNTTAAEMDAAGMGGKAKIQPPLRHEADRERLWKGLADGTISVVGTDSLTYSSQFKTGADFWECRVGVNIQFADTLPLMWHEAVNNGRLDLLTLAKVLSENSARRYGLYPTKGAIAVGSDADLVVMDPDREVTLGVDRYRGKTDYSLWEGRKVRGAPVMTFLRGELVMEDGEIVAEKPSGRHLAAVLPV